MLTAVLYKEFKKAYRGHVDSILFLKLKDITLAIVNQHSLASPPCGGLETCQGQLVTCQYPFNGNVESF